MEYNIQYYSGADLICPEKPKKPTIGRNPTPDQARAYADELEEYERSMKRYKDDISDYRLEKQRRLSELKAELCEDYDIADAQTNLLWERAWDQCHSDGLHSVLDLFDELFGLASAFAVMESKLK